MTPFTADDLELARSLYAAIPAGRPRALFDYFVEHPDQQANAAELQAALGFPEHRNVAEATYLIGSLAAERGKRRPWAEAQSGYTMPRAMAELFAAARKDQQAGHAAPTRVAGA